MTHSEVRVLRGVLRGRRGGGRGPWLGVAALLRDPGAMEVNRGHSTPAELALERVAVGQNGLKAI
jgi:hypothetical protein